MLFTYKCYYAFLELYAKRCVNVDSELENEMIEKVAKVFGSPHLKKLFQEISED